LAGSSVLLYCFSLFIQTNFLVLPDPTQVETVQQF
jgi:hypothetical protein